MYHLTGKWTILPGNEEKATNALKQLALDVQKNEPGTLLYIIHTPNFEEKSLPIAPPGHIVFFEIYKDKDAFKAHITGPYFTNFIKNYGNLFLQDLSTPSNMYITVEPLVQLEGFIRAELT